MRTASRPHRGVLATRIARHRRWLSSPAALILLAAVLATAGAAVPAGALHAQVSAEAPTPARHFAAIERARAIVGEVMAEHAVPGMSVAVAVDGEVVWSEGFGYADLEHRVPVTTLTRFRIGSVSKPVTAAALGKLHEEGRLDLDAPVQRYVPSFPEKAWPITSRQLAGHLAGIRHYRGREALSSAYYPTVLDGLEIFRDDPLEFEPGTRYLYSSYGWNLLSAVVEGAAGEDFLAYMKREVFAPLGLRSIVAEHNDSIIAHRARFYERAREDGRVLNAPYVDSSYKWAGGGFIANTEDLVRFGSAHLREGFLSAETLELLFAPQRTRDGESTNYGIGWRSGADEAGRRWVGHTGSSTGGRAVLFMLPEQGIVVAALANLRTAPMSFQLAGRIAEGFLPNPLVTLASPTSRPFDVLITGGRVLDGTGAPAFRADVGIRDGRIAAIGRLGGAPAERIVDARGKVVLPGFIDLHSHADDGARPTTGFRSEDARRRAAPNVVMQGVTTVVVNQDGRSPWPIREQRELIEQRGIGPNTLLLVGHGQVRREVMGDDYERPATPEEIERMRALVRQALAEGASGISAGLEYVPGRWSTTDEVAALVEEIVPWRGVYISHQRAEGSDPMWYWPSQDAPNPPTLIDAVRETIEIGERTGATVVASHIKAKGVDYWGRSAEVIEMIEAARARGVDVWGDQYTYATSGTDGNTVLIPRWALGYDRLAELRRREGRDASPDFAAWLEETLRDPEATEQVRIDIAHEIDRRGGAERVVVFEHPDRTLIGASLAEVAERWSVSPVDAAILLQLRGDATRPGGGRLRGFSMNDADVDAYATRAWIATASDGGIALPDDGPSTHARFYGTFPRRIRDFALDRGVITLEHAVRSMTGLPAHILGLEDRGLLREGFAADVVVLDLDELRDTATFFEPHQYPEGVHYVLVNGEFVVDGGELTWALPGTVIPSTAPATPVSATR